MGSVAHAKFAPPVKKNVFALRHVEGCPIKKMFFGKTQFLAVVIRKTISGGASKKQEY